MSEGYERAQLTYVLCGYRQVIFCNHVCIENIMLLHFILVLYKNMYILYIYSSIQNVLQNYLTSSGPRVSVLTICAICCLHLALVHTTMWQSFSLLVSLAAIMSSSLGLTR